MKNPFKFLIYGSGNIANTYISAIQNIPDAEVIAVISRSCKSPSKFPNLKSYKTLSDVNESFDAAIICTPNYYHHINAIEAARMRKHVLCEKPLDIYMEAMDKMIAACKENKVKLAVSYQRRYSSDNPMIKRLIEEKSLGKIFSVDLSIKNYRDDNYYNSSDYRGTKEIDGGGPFIQQASHYIDLYYWFFGMPNKVVSRIGTFVHNIDVEDHGAVICSHKDGMISTITASTATKPGFPAKMEIYSDKGYIILENDIITDWDIDGMENPSKTSHKNTHSGSSTALVEDTTNHEFIITDFIDSIIDDRDPLITGESAKNASSIIFDIYKNQFNKFV